MTPTNVRPTNAPLNFEILFSRIQIDERIRELGDQITKDYQVKHRYGWVLKGAALFLSDLARAVGVDCTFDFVAVSSYGKGLRTARR